MFTPIQSLHPNLLSQRSLNLNIENSPLLQKKHSAQQDRFIPSQVQRGIFDLYQKENNRDRSLSSKLAKYQPEMERNRTMDEERQTRGGSEAIPSTRTAMAPEARFDKYLKMTVLGDIFDGSDPQAPQLSQHSSCASDSLSLASDATTQNPHSRSGSARFGNNRRLLRYQNLQFREKDLMSSPRRPVDIFSNDEATVGADKRTVLKDLRKIKDTPYKILDAPSLQDDFYFNVLDWSSQSCISIGLQQHVFTLNTLTGKNFKLKEYTPGEKVSSIKSNELGNLVAVASVFGRTEILDFETQSCIKSISGHSGRTGALAWKDNILVSGGSDSHILLTDVRSRKSYETILQGHRKEICGLSFNSFDWLMTSGGNDNVAHVWDLAATSAPNLPSDSQMQSTQDSSHSRGAILHSFRHESAIKALAWSPHQNGLLATGGGERDKCIKLWNTKNGSLVKSIQSDSQICNLRFSKSVNELVSTHGQKKNQIELWRVTDMANIATLTGHSNRVLYLDMSPTGEEIVTASPDETLRFWKMFPAVRDANKQSQCKLVSEENLRTCMNLR